MRLIEADELKKRNDKFIIAYGGELAKVIMKGFNDVIDHTPSFDLKKHDAEERRKFVELFWEMSENKHKSHFSLTVEEIGDIFQSILEQKE